MKRSRIVFALACAAALAACDSGPEGPGTLSATVVSDLPLGAVVLEFTGGTIEGFEGRGDTRVYDAELSSPAGSTDRRHRVILLSPTGGELRFGIRVTDLGAPRPTVTALSAASTANARMVASGLQIRIDE